MPLICLAKCILSISASSASCECLFSIFGNTVMKYWNQLSTNTLTNIAELKMFLCDQHLKWGTKKCLKNIFQECVEDANHQFSLQPLDRDMNVDPSLITPSSFILPQFSAPDPTNSCSSHISTQPTTTPQDGLSVDSNLDNGNKHIDADLESNTACNQHLACTSFCTIVNMHS